MHIRIYFKRVKETNFEFLMKNDYIKINKNFYQFITNIYILLT